MLRPKGAAVVPTPMYWSEPPELGVRMPNVSLHVPGLAVAERKKGRGAWPVRGAGPVRGAVVDVRHRGGGGGGGGGGGRGRRREQHHNTETRALRVRGDRAVVVGDAGREAGDPLEVRLRRGAAPERGAARGRRARAERVVARPRVDRRVA